jgi:hypothetical protein
LKRGVNSSSFVTINPSARKFLLSIPNTLIQIIDGIAEIEIESFSTVISGMAHPGTCEICKLFLEIYNTSSVSFLNFVFIKYLPDLYRG